MDLLEFLVNGFGPDQEPYFVEGSSLSFGRLVTFFPFLVTFSYFVTPESCFTPEMLSGNQ